MKQIKMSWYKTLGFIISENYNNKKDLYYNFYALKGYGRIRKYETN